MTTNTGQLPVGGERGSSDLSSNVTREDPDQEICQISESEIDDDAKEVDYDSDQVLSEVHIHPDNGKVDGRFITSYFTLFPPNFDNIVLAPEQTSAGSHDEESDDDSQPGIVLEIRHAMGSTLRDVGLQVWMGSFLLIDYLLEHRALFNGAVALELGAGTGLASIAVDVAGSFEKIICTDYDENLLRNCVINIEQNMPESSTSHVLVRRLNWLADNFFSSSASARVEEPDSNDLFAWSDEDVELWRTKGSLIFGADVIYDDSLTDALVDCLEKLLPEPLPETHPHFKEGRTCILAMEKRYNFSLKELDVVAQAYEYFVAKMAHSPIIQAVPLDPPCTKYCDYERSKDLVLFKLSCR